MSPAIGAGLDREKKMMASMRNGRIHSRRMRPSIMRCGDRGVDQRLPQQPAPQLVQPQPGLQVQAAGFPLHAQLHAGADAQQEQLPSLLAPLAPNALIDTTSAVAPTAIKPMSLRI